MDTITLTDGTEIKTDFFVERSTGDAVSFTVYGLTFLQAATLLSDPDKTAVMNVRGENNYSHDYGGYTTLTALIQQGDHLKATMEA